MMSGPDWMEDNQIKKITNQTVFIFIFCLSGGEQQHMFSRTDWVNNEDC